MTYRAKCEARRRRTQRRPRLRVYSWSSVRITVNGVPLAGASALAFQYESDSRVALTTRGLYRVPPFTLRIVGPGEPSREPIAFIVSEDEGTKPIGGP